MLNATLIRDLRKTLNEAQDYGQEALVWNARAIKLNRKDFEDEVRVNARAAFTRARAWKQHIAELCDGTMEI